VVDIDAAPRKECGKIVGQYLHVTRKHHQLGAAIANQLHDPLFLLRLGLAGNREMVIGNIANQRDVERLARVVADNRHDIHRQFADPVAV